MENLLNSNVKGLEISGIRKMLTLMGSYSDVISLTIGQPDFDTPEHILQAAVQAVNNKKTTYTENPGLLDLRKAVSRFMETKYKLEYDPASEIIVTNGATQAIDIAFRTILEPGDEVIIPSPVYPGYEPVIRMCGANVIHADTTGSGLKLTTSLLEKLIGPKTKCVVLPYPSNPTGVTLTYQEVADLANFLKDKNLIVLCDEIYSELVYDHDHISIASFPGMKEKTILINGLSKSHSMTGWRIGFTLAPKTITQHMVKVHQYSATCASSISQYAALEALANGINDAEPMREEYRKRRNYMYEQLVAMGFNVTLPTGAFYIFPSISNFAPSSTEFAHKLLESKQVGVVPGNAFGSYGEGFVRMSYASSMDQLTSAMERIKSFLASLK